MTNKKINIFIIIMVVCIAIFFAGGFAYEDYKIQQSDKQYEESVDKLGELQDSNSSGDTSKDNNK